VKAAAATLKRWHPNLQVEAYLAMRSHEWLSFHPVELRDGVWSW
jgi:hypothetical protein